MFKEKKKIFQVDVKHIPHGTQVVTLADRILDEIKYKMGRTGTIVDSNFELNKYKVRFSDNAELYYDREELTIRKVEIENFIKQFAPDQKQLEKHIIYECIVGSRAFGIADEYSDEDVRGIYLAPAELLLSLWGVPEQIGDDVNDKVYWEVEKFIRLALKANPNVLETLWTPIVNYKTSLALELLEIRDCFLSKHIFKTFGGYAISQFEKMKKEYKEHRTFKPKHALHLIRLLISGTTALRDGYIMVNVEKYRDDLLAIKSGKLSFDEIQNWRKQLENEFNQAYEVTELPELPDVERANQFLLDARKFSLKNMLF